MALTDRLPDGAEPDEVFAAFTDWTSELPPIRTCVGQ
jgi:hypothetical protein